MEQIKIDTCRKIRLFFIRLFRGEDAYYTARAEIIAPQLARRLVSKVRPGYVSKRRISRFLDVSMDTVGDLARGAGVQHSMFNKCLYYTVEDAAKVLKRFC